jgi:hypothetical protein
MAAAGDPLEDGASARSAQPSSRRAQWRYFWRGGGLRMLTMMNAPMAHEHGQGHGHA